MPDPNSERVAAVFADAWALYGDAIDVLELGKPRLAAEGAWGAVKRATDAMILARTGREPGGTGQTSGRLRTLSSQNPDVAELRDGFREAIRDLHGKCFYLGICDPPELVGPVIRATADYIRDAIALAES